MAGYFDDRSLATTFGEKRRELDDPQNIFCHFIRRSLLPFLLSRGAYVRAAGIKMYRTVYSIINNRAVIVEC